MPAYGWKPSKPDHRDYLLCDPHAPARLPSKISLRSSSNLPSVYDQGQLGSCTANAIACAYEFELRRQGKDFMPSRLYIYYQERVIEGTVDQDAGAEIRDGLKVVSDGVAPERDWPYDISTFTGPPPHQATGDASHSKAISYYSLTATHGALRACLTAGFPFVFGFSVPESFESDAMASGQDPVLNLPAPEEQFIGGHAVTAIGYDFTCRRFPFPVFEVRNSWGADWGDTGNFFIHFRYFDLLASDLWTIRRVS